MSEQPYLTTKAAADLAMVSVDTIKAAIKSGALRAKSVGGRFRISRVALDDWFENLEDA